MGKSSVRIHNITIRDFKNVEYGSIDFACSKKGGTSESDIMGLYGQNGSGKTALIESLAVLKFVLTGKSIPDEYTNYIATGKRSSHMSFTFEVKLDGVIFKVIYSFDMVKVDADAQSNDPEDDYANQHKVAIENEVLSMSGIVAREKFRQQPLINTSSSDSPFTPNTKYVELMGADKDLKQKLIINKQLANQRSQSFIFYRGTLAAIMDNCTVPEYKSVISALSQYGNIYLYVIDTRGAGLINLNVALPFFFRLGDESSLSIGRVAIKLEGASTIPVVIYDIAQRTISNMNIVLEQIVPGLNVELKKLGSSLLRDNQEGYVVELVSKRDGATLPLRYESEGIKKIISILQLLIVVYNNESMTVAIDELDAGIFEYLLGELLKIIAESGKGQLIFTSHNLRPLETIDKKYIFFSTTNPKNRYIQLENVQTNNNMRYFYYRDINLGGQKEELYSPTNNYEIALSFKEAGGFNGE